MVGESIFVAKDQKIVDCRNRFAEASTEELLLEIAKHGEDSPVPERIAASIVLNQRRQAKDQAMHAELLAEIRRPHWSVTPTFWVGLVAMLAACVAAFPVLFPQTQAPQPAPLVSVSPQAAPPLIGAPSSSQPPSAHLPPVQTAPSKK